MATFKPLPTAAVVMVVVVMVMSPVISATRGDCYTYHDHAAHYKLDPHANNYPWQEVESAVKNNPYLRGVLTNGTPVPRSRPPGQHYHKPVSVVCPSVRFMLKAFTVDHKQCWVIKPLVQQLRYTRCSDKFHHDCRSCKTHWGSIHKCEEDYEWRTVWAYCKTIHRHGPYPRPHSRKSRSAPGIKADRKGVKTAAKPAKSVSDQFAFPNPALRVPVGEPSTYPGQGAKSYPAKLLGSFSNPHARVLGKQGRKHPSRGWVGKVERISLYLPYQCSCKRFRC